MYILRIEHPVPDYEAWKAAFDSDPADRRGSGVRRYRVSRPVGDPHFVTIELEFDSAGEAEAMEASLRRLWRRVEGELMTHAEARIWQVVEQQDPQASRAA